jgi:hypothetical protein
MTDCRVRDLYLLLLVVEAEPFGATVRVEHANGGHLKGIFTVNGREAFVIASLTAAPWRCDRHVRADARRALRSLTTSA